MPAATVSQDSVNYPYITHILNSIVKTQKTQAYIANNHVLQTFEGIYLPQINFFLFPSLWQCDF